MRGFSWPQMRRYWEAHAARWGAIDLERDPEGLTNVCHPGAPLWLNRYYARTQRDVFETLLAKVGPPRDGARALDLGCGAGRWSRLLADRGWHVTGIDLQKELLDRARERHPDVEFVHASVQEFESPEPFDLVTSVTVVQHVPYEEQDAVVARARALLRTGGRALALENVRDRGAHVFANPLEGWRGRFERAGFRTVAVRRYDYSPFLRLVARVRGLARRALGRDGGAPSPDELVASMARGDALATVSRAANRIAVALDSLVEPVLVRGQPALPTVHAGFLFEAV